MDISTIIPHIEALVFASDKPVTTTEVTDLVNNAFSLTEDKIAPADVNAAMEVICEKYQVASYPFEMRESGGGWQFLTKKDFHKTVAQLSGEKFLKRLSSASLETLAIIAYKQPITKGEVEAIRGVNSDYSIQKLLEKELIVITGRNEELPGKPLVYTTSKSFMDYFGINSADELPRIKEVLADQKVEPTVVPHPEEAVIAANNAPEPETGANDDDTLLVVRGNGELIETPDVVVDEDTHAIDPGALNASTGDEHLAEEVNEEMEAMPEAIAAGDGAEDETDQKE